MKLLTSLIAAATILAAASSAQALEPKEFFEQQQLYGDFINTPTSGIVERSPGPDCFVNLSSDIRHCN